MIYQLNKLSQKSLVLIDTKLCQLRANLFGIPVLQSRYLPVTIYRQLSSVKFTLPYLTSGNGYLISESIKKSLKRSVQ